MKTRLCTATIAASLCSCIAACGASSDIQATDSTQAQVHVGGKSATVLTAAILYNSEGSLIGDPNIPQMRFFFSSASDDACTAIQTNSYKPGTYYTDIEVGGPPTQAGASTDTANGAGSTRAWDAGVTVTSDAATDCYDDGDFIKFVEGTVTITTLGDAARPTKGQVSLQTQDGSSSIESTFTATPCKFDLPAQSPNQICPG